ncbi:hypothetical protein HY491_01025 [Candidatus Woesearchaeota archaeon]|nr:hypothetical protein [Candidatus Woesearchaeota archaeon]
MGVWDLLKRKGEQRGLNLPVPPPLPELEKPFLSLSEPAPEQETQIMRAMLPAPRQMSPVQMGPMQKSDRPQPAPIAPRIEVPRIRQLVRPSPAPFRPQPPQMQKPMPGPLSGRREAPAPSAHPEQKRQESPLMPPMRPDQQMSRSMYVKGDDFREITDNITMIRKRLKESDQALVRLNDLKNDQDKLFEHTDGVIEDVQRKLMYVDKVLFER